MHQTGTVEPIELVFPALGLRKEAGKPNIADTSNNTSVAISTALFEILGVPSNPVGQEDTGALLEEAVQHYLERALPILDSRRRWSVERRKLITDFHQYEHLARLDKLIKADETVRAEIGRDYVIKPDVCVAVAPSNVEALDGFPMLHAAVSCKWTLRSDRAQNVRHEAVMLIRHRRGRLPHIVTVTLEPLPTRLAALARGTGEVDGVYHVALDGLQDATRHAGTPEQLAVLQELINQRRLFDLSTLPRVLAL